MRALGPEGRLQGSLIPGRSGYVLTSGRSLAHLRQALMPRWARRITTLHAPSGRYFLEPSSSFLVRALTLDCPGQWWSPAHQAAAASFFTAARRERVRRLVLPGRRPATWTRGFRAVRDLALRLESLRPTPRPDKHWRGLAESFDRLWSETRLYTLAADPLWLATVSHLRCCQAHFTKELEPTFGVTGRPAG